MGTVREVMTAAPVSVPPEATARQAAQLMRSHDIGAVLVTGDGAVRGLVTDRDLVLRLLADGAGPDTPVTVACTSQLVTVGPDDDQVAAVDLMRRHAVRRLPVVEDGTTIGMVSLGDLAVERDPRSALAAISAARPSADPSTSDPSALDWTEISP